MKTPMLYRLYILFDTVGDTYKVGGGSSTPARERVYLTYESAKKNRDRYFPEHVHVVEYKIERNHG